MNSVNCPHCQSPLPAPVEIIPVGEAVLCANCGNLTRSPNGHCRACGSAAVANLEKMLHHQGTKTRIA
jgi:hypothetical protein